MDGWVGRQKKSHDVGGWGWEVGGGETNFVQKNLQPNGADSPKPPSHSQKGTYQKRLREQNSVQFVTTGDLHTTNVGQEKQGSRSAKDTHTHNPTHIDTMSKTPL